MAKITATIELDYHPDTSNTDDPGLAFQADSHAIGIIRSLIKQEGFHQEPFYRPDAAQVTSIKVTVLYQPKDPSSLPYTSENTQDFKDLQKLEQNGWFVKGTVTRPQPEAPPVDYATHLLFEEPMPEVLHPSDKKRKR